MAVDTHEAWQAAAVGGSRWKEAELDYRCRSSTDTVVFKSPIQVRREIVAQDTYKSLSVRVSPSHRLLLFAVFRRPTSLRTTRC